jgi:hypothetical protein
MKATARQLKSIEKLNQDLQAFAKETEEEVATLYEDIYTSFTLSDIELDGDRLSFTYDGKRETERMMDEDDLKEWLKFWRSCLKRAKRYWGTDSETLDAISDGIAEDIEVYNEGFQG